MATAVVSIICIALIVLGGMTMSQGIVTSADTAGISTQRLSVRESEIMRTRLTGVSATLPSANNVQVVIENSGQTRLAGYDKWDFIVKYYDSSGSFYTRWLPYTDGMPGDNEWRKTGIELNGQPEVFEPDILNPGEQISLEAVLSPAADYRSLKMAIAAPNGISATITCGPPTLTAHSETVTLSGTNYYMLKGWTPADGSAITETTYSIGNRETGRWLLHNSAVTSRYATHLFPLSNVDGISATTWTVRYRARADGWNSGTYTNAVLSIDIHIVAADGTIRDTIATDVAQAAFTSSDSWINISATYNFPGYTVVDDTDYLEIDYYGASVGLGPSGNSYIRLRVDDNFLPETSQTRIQGLSWS